MKAILKNTMLRFGLFYMFDMIRRLPASVRWVRNGCSGVAPPPIKRLIISAYLKRYNVCAFIETGTHLGDTLEYVRRNHSINCVSIELAEHLYQQANARFQEKPNVSLYHGDSADILPRLVAALQQPTLFWLDGHYSGGLTAKGQLDTPISTEIQAILQSPIEGHVVLIDDVRCFDGSGGYPFLDQLLTKVRTTSNFKIEVSADIIRLTPGATN